MKRQIYDTWDALLMIFISFCIGLLIGYVKYSPEYKLKQLKKAEIECKQLKCR